MNKRKGLTLVELVILIVVVAAGLVGVGVYWQRGYQGYLYNSASTHGVQFDPTQPYSDTQTANRLAQITKVEIITDRVPVDLPSGSGSELTDVPGGTLPAGTLGVRINMKGGADWDISRRATYEAQ